MAAIPYDPAPDGTLALLREGYEFIGRRCRRHDSDLFRTRLLLRPVVCLLGREAAALLYDGQRFTRRGAVPARVRKLLQDDGSVQSLDDEAHRHRKRLFMTMMSEPEISRLSHLAEMHWRAAAAGWQRAGPVVLHDAMQEPLCAAACAWIGLPLAGEGREAGGTKSLGQATLEQGAMVEGAGAIGPRHWRARLLRARSERWLRGVVEEARSGRLETIPGTPLHAVVAHRDLDGSRLGSRVAAVELDNLLRPIVAVARFAVFAALALHRHPALAEALRGGDAEALRCFVQEVRRTCPFFPFIGGRARRDFEWRGHRFRTGDWALLDLYGTNHDPRIWEDPGAFRPQRFRNRAIGPYDLVPQGAGDFHDGHRCPGEWISIALTEAAVRALLRMDYRVPEQDLSVDLARFPALPASGFVIEATRSSD